MSLIILGVVIFLIAMFASRNSPIGKWKGLLGLAGIIVVIVGIATSAVRQVDAGRIGVQVLFGEVQKSILHEGLNFVNPLVDVNEMSIQTQNYTMSAISEKGTGAGDDAIRVLSKDGLEVIIDLTVLYRIIPDEAPKLFREIGMNYQDKIIRPITRTGIRESASYFDAIDLFAEKREEFENRIKTKIENDFKTRGLIIEQMLIRNITLPTSVKESIERKITAVQESQRMKFVLEREEQEAERKRVEAKGIADAQRILNEGLSDRVLQYESINVQKELVNSPNSKIIILGSGKNSPPFIIGN